jgi:hypothetical protein
MMIQKHLLLGTYEIQSWAGRTDEDQYCLPIIYDERPK